MRPQIGKKQPGGGCAIIYNDNKYRVANLELSVPEGVEAAWAVITPDHIIENIHMLRAKFDNEITFGLVG